MTRTKWSTPAARTRGSANGSFSQPLLVATARAAAPNTAVAPTGVVVWLCTVVVGMALRKASSAGVAASFVVVAASVTALLLLGWRAVAGLALRRRTGV
ncbi:DUF3054 family protein [Mycobacterium malmoense]|uniref:DUF3054 family protein n=1 Tax=Mycobacterium malmoense TaxID=1780 RepID=UPI003F8840B3